MTADASDEWLPAGISRCWLLVADIGFRRRLLLWASDPLADDDSVVAHDLAIAVSKLKFDPFHRSGTGKV